MAEPIPEIQLPPITILANGSNDAEREANLKTVLSSPGYPETLFMLVEVFERRVEDVLLDYTRDSVAVRFRIDGVGTSSAATGVPGDYMLAVLKKIANLDHTDRRSKQSAEFGAKYRGSTMRLTLTTQGVRTGERVLLSIGYKGRDIEKFEDSTIRPAMLEQWVGLLRSPSDWF
ncbi:MAG: hypothetical protein R3B96_11785 [Pirellulaceae bacterium]